MANDDNEQWQLPESLRLTNPKTVAAAAELRKQLEPKAISPFAHFSPEVFAQNRALARINHLTRALQQVRTELRTARGRYSVQKLHEAEVSLSIRLAENYAVLGHYATAAQLDPRPEYKAEYQSKIKGDRPPTALL